MARLGYIPSLCTSCYRVGRTGKDFHELAGSGNIKDYCSANAVLTLKEYILDSANGSRAACNESIRKEIEVMTDGEFKEGVEERLSRIEAGERDIYY